MPHCPKTYIYTYLDAVHLGAVPHNNLAIPCNPTYSRDKQRAFGGCVFQCSGEHLLDIRGMDILHPSQFQFLPRTQDTRLLNALSTVLDNVRSKPLLRGMHTRTLDTIILRYHQPQTRGGGRAANSSIVGEKGCPGGGTQSSDKNMRYTMFAESFF